MPANIFSNTTTISPAKKMLTWQLSNRGIIPWPPHFAKDSIQLRRHKLRKRDTLTATVQPWVVVCIMQGVQCEHLKWMSLFMSLRYLNFSKIIITIKAHQCLSTINHNQPIYNIYYIYIPIILQLKYHRVEPRKTIGIQKKTNNRKVTVMKRPFRKNRLRLQAASLHKAGSNSACPVVSGGSRTTHLKNMIVNLDHESPKIGD